MACSTCSSSGGIPSGCGNNGSCGTHSCGKLTVFNWLTDMALPEGQEPCWWVEVRFKNGRKDFYYNAHQLHFYVGNAVAVETGTGGYDLGSVSLTGELVRVHMRKKAADTDVAAARKLLRKATERDLEKWEAARAKEGEWMTACRQMAVQHGLDMKVSDVEAQGDAFKAFFYYTAEERVDFRQLVRDLSAALGIRVEMLRGMMWFAYRDDRATWIALKAEDAKAMMEMNARGEKPAALEDKQVVEHRVKADDFVEIVAPMEDSLTRFDKPKKKNRSFNKRGNRPPQKKA